MKRHINLEFSNGEKLVHSFYYKEQYLILVFENSYTLIEGLESHIDHSYSIVNLIESEDAIVDIMKDLYYEVDDDYPEERDTAIINLKSLFINDNEFNTWMNTMKDEEEKNNIQYHNKAEPLRGQRDMEHPCPVPLPVLRVREAGLFTRSSAGT